MVFVLTGPLAAHATAPSLIVQYNFDGNLEDALGNSTLTAFGTTNDGYNRNNATSGFGTDPDGTYWYWTSTLSRGGGFWIDINQNISESYSVGVRFLFNQTGPGYRKIIDYRNSTSDTGFYFLGGRLNFYPLGTGTTTIADGGLVDVVATRDQDGTFTAYFVVNGQARQELRVTNSGVSSQPILVNGKPRLGFFFDDIATSSEATNGGKVYSIRVWNGPITPDQIDSALNTVSYNGNGHTGGQPPVDTNSYAQGVEATVLGNTGSLVKEGHVFSGWNTAADGSGTAYAPESALTMGSAGVTLYAVWAPAYFVTYDGNDHTGGEPPVDESPYVQGAEVTVLGNTGSLVKEGHVFSGWNTVADGSGTAYAPGSALTMGSAGVTLYAVWGEAAVGDPPIDPVYTVTYFGNGSTRGTVPVDETEYREGASVTVLDNTGNLFRTRHTFRGWNTAADGSGTAYRHGDSFEIGAADVHLYAQWRRVSTSTSPVVEPPVAEPEPEAEPEEPERIPFTAHFYLNRTDYLVMENGYVMDTEPVVRKGRVLLPLRYAAYAVGIEPEQINWDPDSRTVIIETDSLRLEIVIGAPFMTLNGEIIALEVPAEIINGRTMLPLRAISEALGYEVMWLEDTREVVIRSFR